MQLPDKSRPTGVGANPGFLSSGPEKCRSNMCRHPAYVTGHPKAAISYMPKCFQGSDSLGNAKNISQYLCSGAPSHRRLNGDTKFQRLFLFVSSFLFSEFWFWTSTKTDSPLPRIACRPSWSRVEAGKSIAHLESSHSPRKEHGEAVTFLRKYPFQ